MLRFTKLFAAIPLLVSGEPLIYTGPRSTARGQGSWDHLLSVCVCGDACTTPYPLTPTPIPYTRNPEPLYAVVRSSSQNEN